MRFFPTFGGKKQCDKNLWGILKDGTSSTTPYLKFGSPSGIGPAGRSFYTKANNKERRWRVPGL